MVQERTRYVGKDEDGNPIFDNTIPLPTLKFHGTVKLHGTNASICYNQVDGLWIQSRERIITPESDNAGFAWYVTSNIDKYTTMINEFAIANNIDLTSNTICVYGEWCGGSIQSGVALNQLNKMFVVFEVKTYNEEDGYTVYNHSELKDEAIRCFNINQFESYDIEIDFNNPAPALDKITEMTVSVEDECPVGKHFGVHGIGEGIVFTGEINGTQVKFKSKGEKHSNSKGDRRSKLKASGQDEEQLRHEQLKINIALTVTPDWRVKQGIQEVCNTLNGGQVKIEQLGSVIKWVISDIVKEEFVTINNAGLTIKELNGLIANIVRACFFEVYNAV
jgi:hypothetical protein